MSELPFPWDQLSPEDHEACRRDLNIFGNCFARKKPEGGYRRVPPETIDTSDPAKVLLNDGRGNWWER